MSISVSIKKQIAANNAIKHNLVAGQRYSFCFHKLDKNSRDYSEVIFGKTYWFKNVYNTGVYLGRDFKNNHGEMMALFQLDICHYSPTSAGKVQTGIIFSALAEVIIS